MRPIAKPIIGGIVGFTVGWTVTLLPRPFDFIAIMLVLTAGLIWALWAIRDVRRQQRELERFLAGNRG